MPKKGGKVLWRQYVELILRKHAQKISAKESETHRAVSLKKVLKRMQRLNNLQN